MQNFLESFSHFKLPFSAQILKKITLGIIFLLWLKIFLLGYDFSAQEFLIGKIVTETGELSWILLIFTIFISLLQKLFPKIRIFGQLLPLRKYTGILAFLVIISHLIFVLLKWGILETPLSEIVSMYIADDWAMIFGVVAFWAMFPAFVTSTLWAMKAMGAKFWKNIQRLTHVSFVFAALHIAFLRYHFTGEVEKGPLVLLALYVLGYSVVFWRKYQKKKK